MPLQEQPMGNWIIANYEGGLQGDQGSIGGCSSGTLPHPGALISLASFASDTHVQSRLKQLAGFEWLFLAFFLVL
jgi:hypothetical protein